jgi:hypothetical protein
MNQKWRRTDGEIADAMGFDLSTIRNHRARLGLPTNVRPRKATNMGMERAAPAPKDRPNPVETALRVLGSRLVEKPESGFWLDGQPASTDAVMRAANEVLKRNGLEQVGVDRWRVE